MARIVRPGDLVNHRAGEGVLNGTIPHSKKRTTESAPFQASHLARPVSNSAWGSKSRFRPAKPILSRSQNAILDLQKIARRLGGAVVGGHLLVPGPGHSDHDRSLAVFLDPYSPDMFRVHSHAGDDWKVCRDYVKAKLVSGTVPSTRGVATSRG